MTARLGILTVIVLLALATGCGGGANGDSQATIDAAVQGTITNQPTATPDVQATVDAAVAATAAASTGSGQPDASDLQSTVEALVNRTATPSPLETATPITVATATATVHPEKLDQSYYESRLRSLLSTADIPDVLFGSETTQVGFTDFGTITDIPAHAIAFTGLTFQGDTTAVLLQVTDFETDLDAVSAFEEGKNNGDYGEPVSVNGKDGARISNPDVSGVIFVDGGSVATVLFTGSAVGSPEWDALENLAQLVEERL